MCSSGPTKREIDASIREFQNPKSITFDEALASDQPVVELAIRLGLSESQPMTESELVFWNAFYFLGDSFNGGVCQALSNSTGDVFDGVHRFARKYCSSDMGSLFDEIAGMFPRSIVPTNRELRNELLDAMDLEEGDPFESIDMRLYELENDYLEGLLKFAETHRSEFKNFSGGAGDA